MAKTGQKKLAQATSLSPKQIAAQSARNKAGAKKVAATRRTAQQKAANLEVTDISEWKKDTTGGKAETKLQLPSGKVCLVKLVGLEPFFKQGLIPNNLLPIVADALSKGKGLSQAQTTALITDQEMIKAMLELADKVVCEVVLKPTVVMPPDDVSERDPATLYIDEVDLQDKMFIFQFVVGGTRDLETFRSEQEAAVVTLADGEAVPAAAQ